MIGFKSSKKKNSFVADPGRPIFLGIESYKGMSKSQLEKYLYGIAEKNVQSLRACNYQMIKIDEGYVTELHDGGNGYGVLQSVMRHLEDNHEAVIETSSNRKIKVVKKVTKDGTTYKSFALNEDDKTEVTDSIAYVDKLTPLITPGHGFWRLSIAIATVGVMTLFMGAIFKYVVYDTTSETNFISTGKTVPLKQLNELIIAKPHEGNYISALKYKDSNWSREEKPLIQPVVTAPVATPATPAIEDASLPTGSAVVPEEIRQLNEVIGAPQPVTVKEGI
jgi:hypothetical protein